MINKRNIEQLKQLTRMGNVDSSPENRVDGLIELIETVQLKNKRVCEIGCFRGVSTETFLQYSPAEFYAVDIWGMNIDYHECDWLGNLNFANIEREFREMTTLYDNVHIIKNYSIDAAKLFSNNSLDLVYIDGEHTYEAVKNDIQSWLPKISYGGYIAGHDYVQPQLKQAVCENFPIDKIKTFKDSSWLVRIN
jgi:predicted O-methyltransferase YrrM